MTYYKHPHNTYSSIYKLSGWILYKKQDDDWVPWYDWSSKERTQGIPWKETPENLCKCKGYIKISEAEVMLELL